MSVLPSCCGSFTALESKHHVADGSPHQLVAAAHPVPKESQRPSTTKAEWDGRTTTVFRAACFGPDPQALAAHETTTRRSEIDWLYRGVARFFPEEWERYRAGVPEADRDGDLVAAYARLMENPDSLVRTQAASAWSAWEDAVLSLEPNAKPNLYSDRPPAALLAMVRICAHYFAHGAWLEEGTLLRDAGRLAGIPGVLIHGRLDLGGPLDTAWELARAWPDAELVAVRDAGHQGSDTTRERLRSALDTFARR